MNDLVNVKQQDSKAAWYAVFVLLLAYVLSFVDRIILSLLVTPIKADLGTTDAQMGLLMGFAFAIFYTVAGIPIAKYSDVKSRRMIIAIGVFLWSIMTAVCGLARSFFQLFLARVGVGVGEAALTPAAYSMISDYFSEDKLGRAMAVYKSGAMFGGGLAFRRSFSASRLPHHGDEDIINHRFSRNSFDHCLNTAENFKPYDVICNPHPHPDPITESNI